MHRADIKTAFTNTTCATENVNGPVRCYSRLNTS